MVIRAWALLDLVLTLVLALPPTAGWLIQQFYHFSNIAIPAISNLSLFLACTTGGLGVLWALVRLMWPAPRLALTDIAGRCWIAGLIAVFICHYDLPIAFSAFIATELVGALHQASLFVPGYSHRLRLR